MARPTLVIVAVLTALTGASPAADLPDPSRTVPVKVLEVPHYCEGVVFDHAGNGYVSEGKRIVQFSPDGSSRTWAETGAPNGHKVLADGTHLVCDASRHAILHLAADGRMLHPASHRCDREPLRGPNDLSLDVPNDGFYFTDPGGSSREKPIGTVHYVDANRRTYLVDEGLAFPNGIVLTPDGDRLLVAESQKNRVLVYDVLSPGVVGPRRIFAKLPVKDTAAGQIDNQPDGMCLDAAGNLYVAHYGMKQVQVLDPSGKLVARFGGGNITTSNVAFGGPGLDQLYVTGGLGAESGGGGLFRLDLGIAGLAILPQGMPDPPALGPDSQRQAGVPEGKVTKHHFKSQVFAGTERDYWVYVPAQYDGGTPASVMVFQDGQSYVNPEGHSRVPIVFDNLIAKGDMPVTIGIFINPGVFPAEGADEEPKRNRSFEYDSMSDQYARFLLEEILPEVGRSYKLTDDPNRRAICGISSGGICAFTVAWQRPDAFRKVLSYVGSFTNIRGGHVYPALIRKTEPKPIRVFLQGGANDLDNAHGHWPLANERLAAALRFAKYDYRFVYGRDGHNGNHGGAILPDALRWLWRGTCNNRHAAATKHPRRFIYNSDGGNIFYEKPPPMTPADVYTYVDEVVDTGVTTFYVCPNFGMLMSYPSRVTEMLGSGLSAERNADIERIAAERKSTERSIVNLRGLIAAGHDPVELVIDRARSKGLEAFITFRLNEIHDVQTPDSLIVSKFWRDHPAWRVGKPGDEVNDLFKEIIGGRPEHRVHPIVASWFSGALNFAVPQVRAQRLAELREVCERYPIDGIDLDFQRFPIYFPQEEGYKHVETMTGWMREVRDMTRDVGRKRGRPLLVSARVLARPEQCSAVGLDPVTWANEELVDFIVISHYLRNDFPLPVKAFRNLISNVPLYASIEVEKSAEAYRPIARQLWDDGVDGLMMFNFFTWREGGREPPFEILNELGNPAHLASSAP